MKLIRFLLSILGIVIVAVFVSLAITSDSGRLFLEKSLGPERAALIGGWAEKVLEFFRGGSGNIFRSIGHTITEGLRIVGGFFIWVFRSVVDLIQKIL